MAETLSYGEETFHVSYRYRSVMHITVCTAEKEHVFCEGKIIEDNVNHVK